MGNTLERFVSYTELYWRIAIEFIGGLKHDREAMQYEIDSLRRQLHQQR